MTNLQRYSILIPVLTKAQVNARVAQLVERDLAKVEAAGSSPVSRFFLLSENSSSSSMKELLFFLTFPGSRQMNFLFLWLVALWYHIHRSCLLWLDRKGAVVFYGHFKY